MKRLCNALDEPPRLLFFTLDEALGFFLPFILGMVMGSPVLGFLLGGALVYGFKHMKGQEGRGFVARWLYWHLPALIPFRLMPPAAFKDYRG